MFHLLSSQASSLRGGTLSFLLGKVAAQSNPGNVLSSARSYVRGAETGSYQSTQYGASACKRRVGGSKARGEKNVKKEERREGREMGREEREGGKREERKK